MHFLSEPSNLLLREETVIPYHQALHNQVAKCMVASIDLNYEKYSLTCAKGGELFHTAKRFSARCGSHTLAQPTLWLRNHWPLERAVRE